MSFYGYISPPQALKQQKWLFPKSTLGQQIFRKTNFKDQWQASHLKLSHQGLWFYFKHRRGILNKKHFFPFLDKLLDLSKNKWVNK